MRTFVFRQFVVVVTIILSLCLVVRSQGQTVSRNGSGVKAMFASQSESYKDSDPTGMTWGLAGLGSYTSGAPLPGLPGAPIPSLSPAGGNAFAGGGYTSFFNDLAGTNSYTAAQSTLDDNVAATPLVTSDISIAIPTWRLYQAPAATGFAYEQLNFGSNYLVTSNPGLAGSTPSLPVYISGSVLAGGGAYAQFDSVIDYTWIPVSVNSAGVITQTGPSSSLGQLTYTFYQSGGGSFNTTLFSSGALAATPAGDGMLSLTGHAWIAGDPFTVQVSTVPEPGVLALLGVGGAVGLLLVARRRWRK
jgi:hypothetical protein